MNDSLLHAQVVKLIESERARGASRDLDLPTKEKAQALRDEVKKAPVRLEATWVAWQKMTEKQRQALAGVQTHKEIVVGALAAVYSVYAFLCGTRYHCVTVWVPEKISPAQAAVATWIVEGLGIPEGTTCLESKDIETIVLTYAWAEQSS